MMKRVLSVACLVFLLTNLHGQNWPSFGAPARPALPMARTLPYPGIPISRRTSCGRFLFRVFRTRAPIVWGDRVFVLTVISSDSNPEFRRAFALEGIAAGESSNDMAKQSWRLYCHRQAQRQGALGQNGA